MSSEIIEVINFEKNNKNLRLVAKSGDGAMEVSLFYNPNDKKYYSKGPFGRWDIVCYLELKGVDTDEGAIKWLKEMNDLN